MARIKGNTNVSLTLGTDEVGTDLISYEFTDGEGEQLTFADFASGDAPVALALTFVLRFDADSAFDVLWENAGSTGVDYELIVNGDLSVSQTNPRFFGEATLPPKPKHGLEAANEAGQFEVEIQLDSFNKAITAGV